MKNQWIAAAAIMMVVSLGAFRAAAQEPGPQGVGATEATQNAHTSHSYNPIKWIKRDPSTATQNPKKVKNKKHSVKHEIPDTTTAASPNT